MDDAVRLGSVCRAFRIVRGKGMSSIDRNAIDARCDRSSVTNYERNPGPVLPPPVLPPREPRSGSPLPHNRLGLQVSIQRVEDRIGALRDLGTDSCELGAIADAVE